MVAAILMLHSEAINDLHGHWLRENFINVLLIPGIHHLPFVQWEVADRQCLKHLDGSTAEQGNVHGCAQPLNIFKYIQNNSVDARMMNI